MGRLAAIDKTKTSLTKAIDAWIQQESNEDSWGELGTWIGNNLAKCMADAAMAVMHGMIDCQDFLRNEDMLKD